MCTGVGVTMDMGVSWACACTCVCSCVSTLHVYVDIHVLYAGMVSYWYGQYEKKMSVAVQDVLGEANALAVESFNSIRTLHSFSTHPYEVSSSNIMSATSRPHDVHEQA